MPARTDCGALDIQRVREPLAQAVAEGLFDAVKRQALLTESVIVSYSGGKESAVTLDLAARHFKAVHVFFMHQVAGLSFQEAVLKWAEKHYGLEIYRIPHWELSHFYKAGTYCKPDPGVKLIGIQDVYAHVRGAFDCHWIAAGERCKDSTMRNAMIKKSGSIDKTRGRFFPLAYWSKEQVNRYIAQHGLKVSPESKLLGHSFRSLDAGDLMAVRQHYPADFARIVLAFPECEVAIAREEMYGKKQAPALCD